MSNQQFIAVKPTKDVKKLVQQLGVARESLLEKDRIIEGLRLDLANLVEQLPRIMPDRFNKAH
jgi:hypothetical protein